MFYKQEKFIIIGNFGCNEQYILATLSPSRCGVCEGQDYFVLEDAVGHPVVARDVAN